MQERISNWQLAGFLVTAALGSMLHFLFDWTGGSLAAALFSAVNESTWEHMKLLFWPMLAVAAVEYAFWGRGVPCFWGVKLMGQLAGLAAIPVIFYTYTGALGVSADWFNIAIFFLADAAAFRLETVLFRKKRCWLPESAAVTGLAVLAAAYLLWTFVPPQLPLFRDPISEMFGV